MMLLPISAGRTLVGWVWWAGTAEPVDLFFVMICQCRVESTSRRSSAGKEEDWTVFLLVSCHSLFVNRRGVDIYP